MRTGMCIEPGTDAPLQPQPGASLVVIDTNIALDVLLFNDARAQPLRTALQQGSLRWIATPRMRDELERVLAYPQIAPRLAFYGLTPATLLAQRDALCQEVEPSPRCTALCKDADDQCFIDLAVAHRALLLSKDTYVLRLRKQLALLGVRVGAVWEPEAQATQQPQAQSAAQQRSTLRRSFPSPGHGDAG